MADDLGTCPHCGKYNPSVDIAVETAARLLWRIQQIMVGAEPEADADPEPPAAPPPFLGGQPWPESEADDGSRERPMDIS